LAEAKVRIHHLAKQLDVKSKDIISKCKAEGIDIKNHMHVVSAGLEATIREWFSEGSHTTTLEEAKRVDLKKLRRKKKAETKKEDTEAATATATAELEAEAPPPATEEAAPKRVSPKEREAGEQLAATATPEAPAEAAPTAEPSTPEPAAAETAEPETITTEEPTTVAAEAPAAADAPVEQAPPTQEAEEAAPPKPAAKPKKPTRKAPPPVAGPQNIPTPAQLSGPKVIRIERPDDDVDVRRPSRRPAAAGPVLPADVVEDEDAKGKRGKGKTGTPTPERRTHPRRGPRDDRGTASEKLREWRDRDLIERRDRLAQASGRGIGGLRALEGRQTARRTGGGRRSQPAIKRGKIELTEPILVKDFSRESGLAVAEIVRKLMQDHGLMATINSGMDSDIAQLIADEYGIELEITKAKTGLDKLAEEFAAIKRKRLEPRPPIVTVLGHVDHGKTSLLDRIRRANVTAGEAGGITQHIGAYRVKVEDKYVAFVDTPGHTAFTAMRARGAQLTDVVVLVVAADDGVMPTTIEAINHAKAANTPIVVALNKIDLPHDLNKIYGQLAEQGLTPSGDWGGDTDVIKTSATTGVGIEDLLSHLATLSEVMELKADPTIPGTGIVIEAERTGTMGNVARIMVQEGTLKPGDVVVCGSAFGRVRAMKDDTGKSLKKAGPSTPIEISGLNDVPRSGDKFYVVENQQRAKQIAEEVAAKRREEELVHTAKPTSLESMLAGAAEGEIPELSVIIRADVQGSVDVLKKTLSEIPDDQVKLNILHAGVGAVAESDIVLAGASGAIVIGFHVVADPAIQRLADQQGVDVRTYRVIYELLDDIRKALEGMLAPDERLEQRGRAEVREIFHISRVGKIAGCIVRDGVIERNHVVRIIRDGVVVKDRIAIASLRRIKDDVKEVRSGLECGIRIQDFDDVKPQDVIEAFELIQVARTLDS
jgi:translation initiation factor IF-2